MRALVGIGSVVGNLTVVGKLGVNKSGTVVWECMCVCGVSISQTAHRLMSRKDKSCGCISYPAIVEGQVFGQWTVIGEVERINNGKYVVTCKCSCGTEKKVYTSDLRNGKTTRCVRCKIVALSDINRNEDLTQEEREHTRKYVEYAEWRMSVFVRDKFTCKVCGLRSDKSLQAHHMESYTKFPEYRLLTINGVTLCKCCHMEFHKSYGYKNNTLSQFLEWQQIKGFKL